MSALAYFIQGVRMSGFVGSSLVAFFSLLIFLTFMSQFYAFFSCWGVYRLRRRLKEKRPPLSWEAARFPV